MKKRILNIITLFTICIGLFVINSERAFASTQVASTTVTHTHTGSGGACYRYAQTGTENHWYCTVDGCCSGWGAVTYLYCSHGHNGNFGIDEQKPTYGYVLNCSTGSLGTVKMMSDNITLSADISGVSGATVTAYSWKLNGTVISTSSTCSITNAGTYTLTITWKDSKSGNTLTSTLSYTVTFAITTLTPSTTAWTNSDITVSITTAGTASSYSKDGVNYQTSNVLTISSNGTYTFYAKNSGGLVVNKALTISNIDKTTPNISITGTAGGSPYTENTWNSKDVVLTATDSVTHPSSYTVKWYKDNVLISGATSLTYTVTTTSTVDSTFKCEVTTGAGNSNTQTFKVKIDKTVPNVTINGTTKGNAYSSGSWTNGSVTLTASDSVSHPSGYTTKWYKDGVLISNATSNSIMVDNKTSNETVY